MSELGHSRWFVFVRFPSIADMNSSRKVAMGHIRTLHRGKRCQVRWRCSR